ncbi:hypothetical protein BHM03_00059215, partial [Ensete ventricosum]
AHSVEFRSVFHAPSQKFKNTGHSDILAHCKSYEHGYAKKCNDHKLCTQSQVSINFSCTILEIQNIGHS